MRILRERPGLRRRVSRAISYSLASYFHFQFAALRCRHDQITGNVACTLGVVAHRLIGLALVGDEGKRELLVGVEGFSLAHLRRCPRLIVPTARRVEVIGVGASEAGIRAAKAARRASRATAITTNVHFVLGKTHVVGLVRVSIFAPAAAFATSAIIDIATPSLARHHLTTGLPFSRSARMCVQAGISTSTR